MSGLDTLSTGNRKRKERKRVGRGPSTGMGKTCGRGHKGSGARSGYRRRHGTEGGNLPLYRKLPCRGFTRGMFLKRLSIVNLWQIEKFYADGEEVNPETLHKHGFIGNGCHGVKILAVGDLTKKVTISVHAISLGAREKLDKAGISYTILE